MITMMRRRSRRGRTTTMMMMTMKFVPVLKTLSLFAEEAGTVKAFFATLDRIGRIDSWPFHQSRTLVSFFAKLNVSNWIISLAFRPKEGLKSQICTLSFEKFRTVKDLK